MLKSGPFLASGVAVVLLNAAYLWEILEEQRRKFLPSDISDSEKLLLKLT